MVRTGQVMWVKSIYLSGSPLVDFVSRTAQEPVFPPVLIMYALFTPAFSFSAFSFAAESSSPTLPQYAVTLGPRTYCRSSARQRLQSQSKCEAHCCTTDSILC